MIEWIKHLSDKLILSFLSLTSSFEKELTESGRFEQRLWREQRLRNLKALAVRSRQRLDAKKNLTH